MDKDLTIAHMQGKFKMVVVDNVGHVIQEDRPDAVAQVFLSFLEKFHIQSSVVQGQQGQIEGETSVVLHHTDVEGDV